MKVVKTGINFYLVEPVKNNEFHSSLILQPFLRESTPLAKIILAPEGSKLKSGEIICHDFIEPVDIKRSACKIESETAFFLHKDAIRSVIREGKFVGINNLVYLKADRNKNRVVGLNGQELIIPERLNHQIERITLDGEIMSLPLGTPENFQAQQGDKVYFHHFATTEDQNRMNYDGEEFYELALESLYCVVRDEKITMLNEWNLVEPVKEEIKKGKLYVKNLADYDRIEVIMRCPSPKMQELGYQDGDKLHLRPDGDYEIKVEGKTYFRVTDRWINGKFLKSA